MLLLSFLSHLVPIFLFCTLAFSAEDFYKVLGLDKSCNDRDLKRAYRSLSKKHHPDKASGNEQKFVEISEAYEVLSDPTTRKIYDQYGHDGLNNHRRGGGQQQHQDPFAMFSSFFGGGSPFDRGGGGGGVRRGPDMEVHLRLPLRDFYNGRDIEFTIEKQHICDDCEGTGSADGKVETCSQCNGRGVVVQKAMLAPGIFQQIQVPCDRCQGQGKTIKHKCKACGGAKVLRKAATLTATLDKGLPKNHRVVFENEADEHPDHVAGNLNVVLQESPPELSGEEATRTDGTFFRRKDRDLYWREVLSLREAWMGDWSRNLTHLDGHVVHLSRKRGEVVQPGQVETVDGEGMPIWHDGHVHEHDGDETNGKLFVEYLVVLPDQMDNGMEKDFWATWEKWRKKIGVNLHRDSGRPVAPGKDEL